MDGRRGDIVRCERPFCNGWPQCGHGSERIPAIEISAVREMLRGSEREAERLLGLVERYKRRELECMDRASAAKGSTEVIYRDRAATYHVVARELAAALATPEPERCDDEGRPWSWSDAEPEGGER